MTVCHKLRVIKAALLSSVCVIIGARSENTGEMSGIFPAAFIMSLPLSDLYDLEESVRGFLYLVIDLFGVNGEHFPVSHHELSVDHDGFDLGAVGGVAE